MEREFAFDGAGSHLAANSVPYTDTLSSTPTGLSQAILSSLSNFTKDWHQVYNFQNLV